jgi:hypothetical protein
MRAREITNDTAIQLGKLSDNQSLKLQFRKLYYDVILRFRNKAVIIANMYSNRA